MEHNLFQKPCACNTLSKSIASRLEFMTEEYYYFHFPHFFSFNFGNFNQFYLNTRQWLCENSCQSRFPSWCQHGTGTGKERWRSGIPLTARKRRLPRAQASFPPPSACVEEEQVHQEERARSPGSKQDAETQRQRKDFPWLPPLQQGAKQRAAQVKGGHPCKELKWVT